MSSQPKCRLCQQRHSLNDCMKFHQMDVHQRRKEIKEKGFCFKCLCSSHTREWCRSRKTCLVCNYNHHTMLHIDNHQGQQKHHMSNRAAKKGVDTIHRRHCTQSSMSRKLIVADQPKSSCSHSTTVFSPKERSKPMVRERLHKKPKRHVFLPTALAKVLTSHGPQKTRLMLNSAGMQTIILRSLVSRLSLRTTRENGEEFCTINLQSYHDPAAKIQICGIVKSTFNMVLPKSTTEEKLQSIYEHLTDLADPHYYKPTNIEIVIANDILPKILRAGLIQTSSTMPIAQSSIFGWVISGTCFY
ncbi:uncharacterized protein LOC142236659 [Haematobia irritans]|uniref:uncharacterized protein LOC142236658 n=1 Tax=Haematobia irritans TaxID=7368 RepID=UPI003F50C4AF